MCSVRNGRNYRCVGTSRWLKILFFITISTANGHNVLPKTHQNSTSSMDINYRSTANLEAPQNESELVQQITLGKIAVLDDINIALNKPVSVSTNGAEDSYNCSGDSPQDITDGSIEYKPVGQCEEDGCFGIVNDDYDQMLELAVTINLQAEYRISTIRYNQGNCQRAETWHADLMISPFGTTSCNVGSPGLGTWTDQSGDIVASSVTIIFQKTRTSWPTDWLFIGEIEIYGRASTIIDTGYLPSKNGYSVQNNASVLTWEMFVQCYGRDAVEIYGRRKPTAQLYFEQIYQHCSDSGSCLGMSASSLLAHFNDIDQSYVGQYGVGHYNTLFNVWTNHNMISELPRTLQETIAYYHGTCTSLEMVMLPELAPIEALEEISKRLKENNNIIIGLINNLGGGAHAVAPYKILKNVADSNLTEIKIYDPNKPGDNDAPIVFNTSTREWTFELRPGIIWHGKNEPNPECLIKIIPIELLVNRCRLSTTSPDEILLALDNQDEFDITTLNGEQATIDNGKFVNTIRGCIPILNWGATDTSSNILGLLLPDSLKYTITNRTYSGKNGYHFYGDNCVLSLLISNPVNFSENVLQVDNSTQKIIFSNSELSQVLEIHGIVNKSGSSDDLAIKGLFIPYSELAKFEMIEAEGIKYINMGEEKDCYFEWRHVGSDSFFLPFDPITLVANSSYIFRISDSSMTNIRLNIDVDNGNDGSIDKTLEFSPKTKIDNRKIMTAAFPTIVCDNFPNPFNNSTTIRAQFNDSGEASVSIVNINGIEIKSLYRGDVHAREITFIWNGDTDRRWPASGGVYFIRISLITNNHKISNMVRKILLIK